MIKVTWTQFKNYVNSTNIAINYLEDSNKYNIYAENGNFFLECLLFKDASANTLDFENNYKNLSSTNSRFKLDVSLDKGSNTYKNFKLSNSTTDTSLSQTYSDVLSLTGSGNLMGFKFVVSNDNSQVRLIIDGNTAMEFSLDEIRDDLYYRDNNNAGLSRFFGADRFGEVEFFPNFPLRYTTDLQIQIRKTVSWGIQLESYHIFYSED